MDLNQIKAIMNMANGNTNPAQIFQNMAQNNPQMQQVLQMCQGQNPKDVFMKMCQERGINPNDILGMFK